MEKAALDQFDATILRKAAFRFGAGPGGCRLISDVENFVYECRQGAEPFILRITHCSHRTVEQIIGELEWIEYLIAHDISTPQPMRSLQGKLVEVIDTSSSYFLVTAFAKIPGRTMIEANACTPQLYERWGKLLGRMHASTKNYSASDRLTRRPTWFENDLLANAEKYLVGQPAILHKCRKLVRYLHALPRDRDSFGLIHTDFTDANFFVRDQEITVFDFDDSEYHWLIYDIAVILFDTLPWLPHAGMDLQELGKVFYGHFMRGYLQANRLDQYWLKQLPHFFKLREMCLYIFFHKKWDFDNLEKQQQEMLDKFRHNIANDLPYLDARLLNEWFLLFPKSGSINSHTT